MKSKEIKFIDLFAGIGGFHKAFEKVSSEMNFKSKCVFVSEIDSYAIQTYTKNFKVSSDMIINIRDIGDNSEKVEEHDFLFAGFPCQAFSNAGNKLGFMDEVRGTLFFEIAKILKAKKPKFFLLENVKHLVSHNNGTTWKTICNTLNELGYLIPEKPLILSPDFFGIPQDRKRVFIPGVRKDLTNENKIEFSFEKYKNNILFSENENKIKEYIRKKFLEKEFPKTTLLSKQKNGRYLIKVLEAWGTFLKNVKTPNGRTLPVIWIDELDKNYEIPVEFPEWKKKYIKDMRTVYQLNKDFIDKWLIENKVKEWKTREKKFEWQAGINEKDITKSFIQLRQSGIRCKKPNKFPTLVAMVQIPLIFEEKISEWRYLSVRESSNLQSFPKNFKLYSEISNDFNEFYSLKQLGNSVNVKVVYFLIKEILEKYGEFDYE